MNVWIFAKQENKGTIIERVAFYLLSHICQDQARICELEINLDDDVVDVGPFRTRELLALQD